MSAQSLIVIGGGGHAKVLLEALMLGGAHVLGLTDVSSARVGTTVLGVPVLGGDEVVRRYAPGEIGLVNGVGSVGSTQLRAEVYGRFTQEGYTFVSVVHRSAVVSPSAILRPGVQVMAGAVVQAEALIEEDAIVNTGATVDHDCRIGRHVHLAPGVTLSGAVSIGKSTHVGSGATVVQGVRIGAQCVIAAGALVVADIPDGHRVAGVPARPMS
jgi:sugar O-acyltransferase (sialic acid O-acetyltransferase NeuD family)